MLERAVDQIFLSCTARTLQVVVTLLKWMHRAAPAKSTVPAPGVALQH